MKKAIIFILFAAFAFSAPAQVIVCKKHFANYTTFDGVSTDTVTNTGTNYVGNLRLIGGPLQSVTIQANLVKISGTQAGTLTILGSLDNVNFKAVPTAETQTSVTTATATDVATQTFVWRITGNPFSYYRVSWTGAGTMASTLAAVIVAH